MPYINFQQLEQLETADIAAPTINWHSVGRSHAGCVRKLNEDAYFNSSEQGLWAVADGMGGHARGDYASGVVVETLVYFAKSKTLASSIRDLEARFREAHNSCRNSFRGERVGATVAALFSYKQFAFLLWAGDSRVYRLRDNALTQMTQDHTVAQERCAKGELSPEQAAKHPSAHVLTRAVGVHQTLHLELDYDTVQQGDRYLLCSDGLYNRLEPTDICSLLGQGSLEQARDCLIDLALEKGGQDNITVIIVEARESSELSNST